MIPMNYIFLEGYCLKKFEHHEKELLPTFCEEKYIPGYSCLLNGCPYFDFTSAENAFAYIGKDSSSKEEILLGNDSDLALWEEICRKKIGEAWREYLQAHPEESE